MSKKKAGGVTSKSVLPLELAGYIDAALECAKTAHRHRQSLSGTNFYADKMADLRADAAIALEDLAGTPALKVAGVADSMQKIFSVDASVKTRTQAARDFKFLLKTARPESKPDYGKVEEGGIFPLAALSQTKRGYLIAVGKQMNGAYSAGWYDASAVMMRRLLESSIIEAFEAKKIDGKIKDSNGDFFQLTALIKSALAETAWNLPRNVKKHIEVLRDLGHASAHNRYYLAKQLYIDEVKSVYRETVEAFLHIANLL